jgi:tetratricopeptide (TPR) repeat protein
MKTALAIVAGLALAIGLGILLTRNPVSRDKALEPPSPGDMVVETENDSNVLHTGVQRDRVDSATIGKTAPAIAQNSETLASSTSVAKVVLEQALNTLLSSTCTFQQKQQAWGQLRDSGKLDPAIADLEQRMTSQPNAPEIPATLGQAYLQKAGTLQDIREQGILGMKADQSFDAALHLDSSNWDARFWKATAMSYWPPQLGKGKEVIEHCLELVKQQELHPPQAQFAQTYVLLGQQYQQLGQGHEAQEIWKRGQSLFPTDTVLQQKIAGERAN